MSVELPLRGTASHTDWSKCFYFVLNLQRSPLILDLRSFLTSCLGLYRYCRRVWWVTISSASRMLFLLCSKACISRHTELAVSLLKQNKYMNSFLLPPHQVRVSKFGNFTVHRQLRAQISPKDGPTQVPCEHLMVLCHNTLLQYQERREAALQSPLSWHTGKPALAKLSQHGGLGLNGGTDSRRRCSGVEEGELWVGLNKGLG